MSAPRTRGIAAVSRRIAVASCTVAAALALASCAGGSSAQPSGSPSSSASSSASADGPSGELRVFAAASLSGAFDELAADFEKANPDVDVVPITYDGSSVLATQLIDGAQADVFASADGKNMAKVTEAALAVEPVPFATNVLQIAVAPGNPHGVDGLASLSDTAHSVVVCAPEVPCGNAAKTLLTAAGVTVTPASEEQNVSAVLAKVKSGEADAGIVYRTDVTAAGSAVTGVQIDGAENATNVYPIAALKAAPNPRAAEAFVAFVLSPAGQKVLAGFGFGAP
ncbi:molybdate transport system substrate-binding protein [Microbacterium resistens]|uniref:Molybdate transport system substrate-binding protein n=1 Tax=Microbacterium resistens TaxID=156977 RepID=A0ABU1SDQ4_9MICO|nr:molybdate ABC transporter substrate-binding protein [Microbacterium resistens]MDR6867740.1 molybdate transport system substrate-binding protein [Microbacterium resistens]